MTTRFETLEVERRDDGVTAAAASFRPGVRAEAVAAFRENRPPHFTGS